MGAKNGGSPFHKGGSLTSPEGAPLMPCPRCHRQLQPLLIELNYAKGAYQMVLGCTNCYEPVPQKLEPGELDPRD